MVVHFTRALRTQSSERYLIHVDGQDDDAVLDLHYVEDGTVAGTLIVLNAKYATEDALGHIMQEIDRVLLPAVSIEEGNLTFTVVQGSVLGEFTAAPE